MLTVRRKSSKSAYMHIIKVEIKLNFTKSLRIFILCA